jgi:hypothetical protein
MSYVAFHHPEDVAQLNMNYVSWDDYSVFPRDIYKRPLVASPKWYDGTPCDTPTGKPEPRVSGKGAFFSRTFDPNPSFERFARFSYDLFPNGYGVGSQVYGYATSPMVTELNPQPKGMAPSRFYCRK